MSCKIKRRLRKTSQDSESSLLYTPGKFVLLRKTTKKHSNFPAVALFESETLSSSSPIKMDKESKKKVRRKKIRSTQDFNQLSNSLTEDSDSSTKTEVKRTKKTKGIYVLPKIDNVVEDSVSGNLPYPTLNKGSTLRRKSRRLSKKSNNEEKQDDCCEEMDTNIKMFKEKTKCNPETEVTLANRTSLVDRYSFDSEIEPDKVKTKNNNLRQKVSVKEISTNKHKSQNSILHDQKYSEGAFEGDSRTKPKKILQKKNKDAIKTNMNNNCNLSNKETDVNNPALNKSSIKLLSQTSPYQGEKCVSSRLSAKQTSVNNAQHSKNVDNSYLVLVSEDNKRQTNDNKQPVLKSPGRMFNDTTNQGELMENRKEKRNKSNRSKSLVNALNTSVKSKRQKKRSIDTFEFMANEQFTKRSSGNTTALSDLDGKIYFIDVFDKTSIAEDTNKSQEIHQVQNITNTVCDLNNGTKMEARKSVRFLSPKEKPNDRRNTFELKETTFDISVLKENSKLYSVSPKYKNNDSIYNKTSSSFCQPQNISSKSKESFQVDILHNQSDAQNNATFEITPSKINISQNKTVIETSLNKNTAQNEILDVTVPKISKVLKLRSKDGSMELPSAVQARPSTQLKKDVYKSISEDFVISKNKTSLEDSSAGIREDCQVEKNISLNYRKSVIDLITPETSLSPKSVHKNSSVIYVEDSNKKVEKNPIIALNRQSTFTKPVESPENEVEVQTSPKLNTTNTVVKDDIQNENLLDQNYDSPFELRTSIIRNIDTSKVNKRRRWNKSQASISFLDSINIEDISAPWDEVSNATYQANDSICYLETKNSSENVRGKDLSKNKISFKSPIIARMSINGTLPSKTSTPFSQSKVLLKQALLNDKRNVKVNESKNLSKVVEKHIAKPIRKKMPNFALIHQRAYEKMESLKEMSERKAVRAKLLLSGHKPTDKNDLRSPSKSKKFLQFSPVKSETVVPLSSGENWKNAENSNNRNILITKIKTISPSKSNLKVVNKENKLTPLEKKLIKSSKIPKPKVPNNFITEKKGFTRYGFKVGSNNVKTATKEEQMKAISTKTKIMKNTVEERRNVIHGVRSNRRFELLMSMRNK